MPLGSGKTKSLAAWVGKSIDEVPGSFPPGLFLNFLQSQTKWKAGAKGLKIGPLDFTTSFLIDASTTHAHDIESCQIIELAGNTVGGDIFADCAVALSDTQFANFNELMESGTSAKEGVVGNADMPCQQAVIGDDILVTDSDIMPHMATGHEAVVITDLGPASI